MITHRIDARQGKLCVTVEVDLAAIQGRLPLPAAPSDDAVYRRLMSYLLLRVGPDVFYTAETLVGQPEIGSVKWFDDARGFGFIRAEDGVECFVHQRHLVMGGWRTLEAGQPVRFTRRAIQREEGGFEALEVTPL